MIVFLGEIVLLLDPLRLLVVMRVHVKELDHLQVDVILCCPLVYCCQPEEALVVQLLVLLLLDARDDLRP